MLQGLPTTRSADCPFDPPQDLRGQDALTRMEYHNGKEGWLATGRSAVRAVLADPRFSVRYELMSPPIRLPVDGPLPPAPPGDITGLDAPDHTRLRRLLIGQFTVRRMRMLTDRIEQIAADHLAAMRRQGPPTDLVSSFALPIPTLTICELLGVPYEDHKKFERNAVLVVSDLAATPDEYERASTELAEYMGELVAAKRATPTDDLLSGLTKEDLGEDELVTLAGTLLSAGLATTMHMLTLGTLVMLRNPELYQAVRHDPDPVVEELLRYLTIVPFTVRTALEDTTVDGQLIKAGESVTLSLQVANRDPAAFDDPDTVVASRDSASHVAFGHGIHQCLGQQLARVEMRVAFRALADEFPSLRLAVPFDTLPGRSDGMTFTLSELPVTWDA